MSKLPIVEQLLAASADMLVNGDDEHDEWAAINDRAAVCITKLVSALEECQRALATMVEPGAIHKTKVLDAFTTVTKAEARARTALSNTRGDTKNDKG